MQIRGSLVYTLVQIQGSLVQIIVLCNCPRTNALQLINSAWQEIVEIVVFNATIIILL